MWPSSYLQRFKQKYLAVNPIYRMDHLKFLSFVSLIEIIKQQFYKIRRGYCMYSNVLILIKMEEFDFKELCIILSVIMNLKEEKRAEILLTFYDFDQDGILSKSEMELFILEDIQYLQKNEFEVSEIQIQTLIQKRFFEIFELLQWGLDISNDLHHSKKYNKQSVYLVQAEIRKSSYRKTEQDLEPNQKKKISRQNCESIEEKLNFIKSNDFPIKIKILDQNLNCLAYNILIILFQSVNQIHVINIMFVMVIFVKLILCFYNYLKIIVQFEIGQILQHLILFQQQFHIMNLMNN
ncbi:unnamed protein product [Paramecium sonneborni]|uniref:EF-hand domain-containing protein n=1 Tax=Paramecium sonneborni TaxID=65129 RepID=A0A8S1MDU5_9CILI|nr:unnamed protein product [Paramecium sonneborni]